MHPLNDDGILNAFTFSTEIVRGITIVGKEVGGFELAISTDAVIHDLTLYIKTNEVAICL